MQEERVSLLANKRIEESYMKRVEKRYGDILQTEEYDHLNRRKLSQFKTFQDGMILSGTQVLDYNAEGDILKRIVTYNQGGVSEIREYRFFYDVEGKIISYTEFVSQDDEKPIEILASVYQYILANEKCCSKKEYLVYSSKTPENGKCGNLAKNLIFKMKMDISENGCHQLYYLPNDVLAFQKKFLVSGKKCCWLSPTGGRWKWILADIDEKSATVQLYETILTFEIFKEITEYCKMVSPNLEFISLAPECFLEPSKELDRIMDWCQEVDIWHGIY